MSYAQAIDRLHTLGLELAAPVSGAARRKFDLNQMRALVAALGHPERAFPSVLIAGTNGKGSTAATLASILEAAGYRTGLYTSPHLERVNERIRINGHDISDDDFARLYFHVDAKAEALIASGALPHPPSFFEMLTALAFVHFAEQKVDIAVLEVGMGGRLDATNIVEPVLSIITDISLDHTEWLGPTIDAIAREKAGILRPNGTLITLPQHPEANRAIGEVATALEVTAINAAAYMPSSAIRSSVESQPPMATIMLDGEPIALDTPLPGAHQHRNVALAIAAAVELRNRHGYNIPNTAISAGIRLTRWAARLEYFPARGKRPAMLLDVAHNPAGAWTLRAALGQFSSPGSPPPVLLFGCMRDKAFLEIAQILFPLFAAVVVTPVPSPRSASVDDLLRAANELGVSAHAASSSEQGLALALNLTPPDGLVVCAGSVYLAGAVRRLIASPGDLR
jgi:dihydrofolate synthase/folylpolyglutamate synthase